MACFTVSAEAFRGMAGRCRISSHVAVRAHGGRVPVNPILVAIKTVRPAVAACQRIRRGAVFELRGVPCPLRMTLGALVAELVEVRVFVAVVAETAYFLVLA